MGTPPAWPVLAPPLPHLPPLLLRLALPQVQVLHALQRGAGAQGDACPRRLPHQGSQQQGFATSRHLGQSLTPPTPNQICACGHGKDNHAVGKVHRATQVATGTVDRPVSSKNMGLLLDARPPTVNAEGEASNLRHSTKIPKTEAVVDGPHGSVSFLCVALGWGHWLTHTSLPTSNTTHRC